jgi:glycosyltransferase involved in cell wall biosynthesis
MNLAIDLRMLRYSGIGRYLQNVVPRVLSKWDAPVHLLVYPQDADFFPWLRDQKIILIPAQSPIYSIAEQWERIWINRTPRSVFWCPHYNIPLFARGKLLVTVYDVLPIHPEYGFHSLLKKSYARLFFQQTVKKADKILAISNFTARELVRHAGCDPSKITVTSLGINSDWLLSASPESPHLKPYLLAVGNVKPHKNLRTLLEAFSSLKNQIPHDLVIVGKKEGFITGDRGVLEQADREGSRIVFTGEITDENLKAYYRHADLLIHPSFYEGFGFPPLEAMAAGCPVLVSNAASLPEVCGPAAVYFDPRQSGDMAARIREILEGPELRKELVHKGREWVRRFTWNTCADQTLQVLRALFSCTK